MKRIRNAGLAAVMALALAATVGAASASASGFVAEGYPATVSGTPSGVSHLGSGGEFGEFSCGNGRHLAATVGSASTSLATEVEDPSCKWTGIGFTMHMNGCGFNFHAPQGTGSKGTFDIGPEGCGPITFTRPSKCEVSIGAQKGLNVSYENTGSGETAGIVANVNATGIKYTEKGGCEGGAGTFTDGIWIGSWNLAAKYESGATVGFRLAPLPTGVFVSAENKFDAEAFPITFSGEQGAAYEDQLTTTAGAVACNEAKFTAEGSGASSELALQPTYSGTCKTKGLNGTKVNANGCDYVLNVSGGAAIACPAEAAIEVKTIVTGTTKCIITVPAQSGLSTVSFENRGSGAERAIKATFSLSGIQYHQQYVGAGAGTCTTGEYSNGTYTGAVTLHGFQ